MSGTYTSNFIHGLVVRNYYDPYLKTESENQKSETFKLLYLIHSTCWYKNYFTVPFPMLAGVGSACVLTSRDSERLSTYTFFKHASNVSCYLHVHETCVTCLLFACYSCYMRCACYPHLTCIQHAFAPTVTCMLSWRALHMSITFMLQTYLGM